MAVISLADAARHTKGLPHQLDAWEWLQQALPDEVLSGFAERFRTAPPAAPKADLVTAPQCEALFGRPITEAQLADLNACLQRFEIDTPARIAHFMAQIAHESGGLQWMEELSSGTAYEGRFDLGNTQPGDGPRFKGAGVLQLTGRANYADFSEFIGDPQVMEGCSYVANHYPFTSAGFWWHNNRMNEEVDGGASCRRISRLVNGRDPANGLSDRETYFAKATQIFSATATPQPTGASKTLNVPYFSQLDSSTNQASRMCFSSSCAMLVAALKPKALPGTDDQYLKIVNQFGDTTDHAAQIQALESLGIKARFEPHADFSTLEEQINRGFPVPCGFIHKGPVDAPVGGGHWLCVVGYTPKSVVVNDPNGDLDLISGVYGSRNGDGLQYSRKNFGRRWMVDENNNYAYAPGRGWAIIVEAVLG
ncbi:MAG: C39 family peptidase [Cyanobacteriota bacterium]|jgi:predicted chitinase|nr:C39 family peptidase [Cyanobacteriota bacterium]